jgi:dihydroorotate dehydrogenase
MQQVQLYDDRLNFNENKARGPFGDYAALSDVYQNKGQPKYNFFGKPIYSPFGIAAGPLPTTPFINAALAKGFDIVTLKSVRTDSFPLNPYPQVRPVEIAGDLRPAKYPKVVVSGTYSDRLAVANSFGIPSLKPEEWQPEIRKSFEQPSEGQALLVAFQGTSRGEGKKAFVEDHLRGIELIRETGADTVEINLSCPNEGETTLACFDTQITERIVKAVRQQNPDINLLIKIAYFEDKVLLRELITKVGGQLDGISAINTLPAPVVDRVGREVFPGRPNAGISGAPIKWAGLEMVEALSKFRKELDHTYKILGMGGVLSAEDFQDYREAGADYVMSVTGAMWNPNLAAEIKASL